MSTSLGGPSASSSSAVLNQLPPVPPPPPPPPPPLAGSSTRFDAMDGSSRSSTGLASHRTLKFLRTIVGKRNDDYCAETPAAAAPRTLGGQGQAPSPGMMAESSTRLMHGRSSSSSASNLAPSAPSPSRARARVAACARAFAACFPPPESRRAYLKSVLDARGYKALLIVLTFILLFGAQIRFIFIPAAGDTGCDVVFMAVFCVFWVDVVMRIDAEPNYFHLNICGVTWKRNRRSSSGNQQRAQSHAGTASGGWCSAFEVGSFLFWCDVVSTLALMQDISFINPDYFSEYSVFIKLDPFGVPVRGPKSLARRMGDEYIVHSRESFPNTGKWIGHRQRCIAREARAWTARDDWQVPPLRKVHPIVHCNQDLLQGELECSS